MTRFEPKRDDYAEAVRTLNASVGLVRTLGIELTSIEPGRVEAKMPLRSEVTQQDGTAHAGTLTSIADTVAGLAAYSLMPQGARILSVNLNVALMRSGSGERLRAVGRVIKAGSRVYFVEAEVFAGSDTEEHLAAKFSATMTQV